MILEIHIIACLNDEEIVVRAGYFFLSFIMRKTFFSLFLLSVNSFKKLSRIARFFVQNNRIKRRIKQI